MELPKHVESSKLYLRLQEDPTLLHTIKSLREISKQLAESISRQLPSFTDHSIRHMDALWNISERVLLPIEIESLTLGEAFLLASSFYLHDIGMAYAATEEGISKIKASKQYRKFKESTSIQVHNGDLNEINAISHAVRCIHATAALEFATHPIPGTSIFLIENTAIREAWAETCGTIASSHP